MYVHLLSARSNVGSSSNLWICKFFDPVSVK